MRTSHQARIFSVGHLLFLTLALCAVATMLPTVAYAELVAYYSFDGNAKDSSGFGNDGTVYGGVLTADRFANQNSAYHFDGGGSHITAITNPVLTITNAISIAAWVRLDSVTADHQVIAARWYNSTGSTWDETIDCGYVLEVDPTGHPQVVVNLGGTGSAVSGSWCVSPESISIGVWHHIVGTYDGVNQSIYVDGTRMNTFAKPGTIQASSAPLWIGAHDLDWDRNPFSGAIDDLRIYNNALSESEVRSLSVVPEPCSALLGAIGLSLAGWCLKRGTA